MTKPASIKVNRAPVLTLWAAVVAEHLGHPPDTALSLARAVAGGAARAKAKRLGRKIWLTHDKDGVVLADDGNGRASSPKPVEAYIAKAFGDHLDHVRRAMEALAANFEPKELNCVGFRLYEHFRPEVPPDVKGWTAKGMLDLEKIHRAGGAE